ncbi:hypothetical protein SASPL_136622 [Salvia splendens]|uniref:Protein kinase domain-containing protein n=1 Tax=Salvia splendens TaxID=180675 RepID=A0A8X8X051_SALSN|nr:hypothetical protein SASPL_136622 [Salvia splendens]
MVAVKRLEKEFAHGEIEFQTELKTIGKMYHRNLVRLVGYCFDGDNKLLVFEYMSNGSLADILFNEEKRPSWEERIEIARDISRGILKCVDWSKSEEETILEEWVYDCYATGKIGSLVGDDEMVEERKVERMVKIGICMCNGEGGGERPALGEATSTVAGEAAPLGVNGQKTVAVKRLEKEFAQGEIEFQTELKTIGKMYHRNLVQLLGYCFDGNNKLLVFEYMSNGSLADILFNQEKRLSWEERMEIARDISSGILSENEAILEEWVYDCYSSRKIGSLVGDEMVEERKVERMVKIGIWCVQYDPTLRPTMKKVLLMLEGTVEIPIPPRPTSFFSSI